jgi:hypothetical protein
MPTVDRTRSAPPPIPSRMWRSLIGTGDAGVQSLQSRTVKDELRSLLALAGTNPERHILRTQDPLERVYQHAAAVPHAHRLAGNIEAW